MEFDQNVVCAAQDEDVLVVAYQNGGIACYDWNKDKIFDEIKDIGPIRSMSITNSNTRATDKILVCGGESGEVVIFRGPA